MMESLIDEIDSLVAPDLSAAAPEWCENCQTLRKVVYLHFLQSYKSFVISKGKTCTNTKINVSLALKFNCERAENKV